MHSVPEAFIISQVQNNPEVKVNLISDTHLIHIKDVLVHMNRNISGLFNEELMLNDASYKSVTGSGDGVSANQDVIIDDEDFDHSGEGSAGSGDDVSTKYVDNGHITPTSSPDSKGPSPSTRTPHQPKPPGGRNSASKLTSSVLFVLVTSIAFTHLFTVSL
ncbi:hypothetical protein Btru_037884 [Bulinus truncatus]|nr:hypothetical protein Btru_037884 [Bulinus truncatus]